MSHFENNYWSFKSGDWFQHDPVSNYNKAPEWYCPDLIQQILDTKTKHEIGCHTFSHIDCRDNICPPDVLKKEIEACQKSAKPFGIDLKTFIFPAHTIGNLGLLKEAGFTNFRSNYFDTLGYPVKHSDGLWEIKSTLELRLREGWSVNYHIKRAETVVERAIKSNTVCHFWFHPSFSPEYLNFVLSDVFHFLDQNRDKIWITTMEDYVKWLDINN